MPINDRAQPLDLIGFLVLKYLIMKEMLKSMFFVVLFSVLFSLVLNPFWHLGYDKIFSISVVLALFFNKLPYKE